MNSILRIIAHGALGALALDSASALAGEERRVLFVLDASGSMGLIASDHRTRFDHARDQVTQQAAQYGVKGYEMGLYVFSHRTGHCDDIQLMVPMTPSYQDAETDIDLSLASLRPLGSTPLANTIKVAAEYIRNNHLEGTELVIVSDGMDTCGTDPVQAARDLYAQSRSKISIIGMDLADTELGSMAAIAQVTGGTFRREFTGAGEALIIPGSGPNRSSPLGSLIPRLPFLAPPMSPGTYSRPKLPPAPLPSPPQTHGREGAPDDNVPIYDPRYVPREITFDHAPPEAPKVKIAAPPAPPKPPAPKPKPSDAPLELPAVKPFLL